MRHLFKSCSTDTAREARPSSALHQHARALVHRTHDVRVFDEVEPGKIDAARSDLEPGGCLRSVGEESLHLRIFYRAFAERFGRARLEERLGERAGPAVRGGRETRARTEPPHAERLELGRMG